MSSLCDILIDPSLEVGEFALHLVVAHSAATDFVGDEDEGGVLGGEAVELGLECLQGVFDVLGGIFWGMWAVGLEVEEEVGGPECDAVDDDYPTRDIVLAEVLFLLDVCPLRASACFVNFNSVLKLGVPDTASGHVNGVVAETEG